MWNRSAGVRSLTLFTILLLAVAATSAAQTSNPAVEILEQVRVDTARQDLVIGPMTPCAAGSVSCGQTKTGRVSVDSCRTSANLYGVGYDFTGTAGQRVTIRASSPSYRAAVILGDGRPGNNTIYADNQAPAIGANAEIVSFTLPYSGPYVILVTPGTTNTFGDYTLTVTCATTPPPPSCTENSTTLCLSGGRFKVQAKYQTSTGQSGDGKGVKLTPDTGYFWFFNQENVELVVKVLNACSFSNRVWVFAGGLTDVQVQMTVTDTKTGTVKPYTNVMGNAFQPIQDTGAFATCP